MSVGMDDPGSESMGSTTSARRIEFSTSDLVSMGVISAGLIIISTALMGPAWELPAVLFLAAITGPLCVIDLRTQTLPNPITLSAIPISLALLLLPAVAEHDWSSYLRAAGGGVVLLGIFAVLHIVSPGGLGLGDVKLAASLGIVLGWISWSAPLIAMVAGFIASAIVSLGLLATRRATRKSLIPFGPFMLFGAWLILLISGFTTNT
jgi:leader peptidase (prepilin peptidase)/N-methyltransferase